jgi:hypothetical protein
MKRVKWHTKYKFNQKRREKFIHSFPITPSKNKKDSSSNILKTPQSSTDVEHYSSAAPSCLSIRMNELYRKNDIQLRIQLDGSSIVYITTTRIMLESFKVILQTLQ